MLNILATFRATREKMCDYYYNGLGENVEREKKDKDRYVTKIYNFFSEPSLINETEDIKVYLGNSYNAANFSTLNDIDVECVINVSNEIPNYFPNNYDYLNISVPDKNNYHMKDFFDVVLNFVFTKREEGKKVFFVHCYYGASRSAIIILLLLIRYFKLPFEDAKRMLERKRNFVNINVDFLNDLRVYLDLEKN